MLPERSAGKCSSASRSHASAGLASRSCASASRSYSSAKDSAVIGWLAIRDALLVVALAPFAYYILSIVAVRRFFRGRPSDVSDFTPPLSILKPIRGLDRETYENYASFSSQDYPEFEILFCVGDAGDPAVAVIKKLIADFPHRPIRLFIGSEPLGASDKVNK